MLAADEELEDLIHIRAGPKTTWNYKIFDAKKSLVVAESMYFANLLKHNPNRLTFTVNCDEDIFEMALEFIEKKTLTPMQDVDKLLALDSLATSLVMNKLKELCVKKMASSVSFQTVWKIYDTNYPPVIENCEWLLKTRTQELLSRPEFLNIKPETLHRFLELDEMNIENEWDLVEACIQFAETEKHGNKKQVFRDYFLQLLRLLVLMEENLDALESFLKDNEMQCLKYWAGFSTKFAPLVLNLCMEKKPRRSQEAFYLVIDPDRDAYDKSRLIWYWPFIESEKSTFVLSFKTKKWIRILSVNYTWPTVNRLMYCVNTGKILDPSCSVRINTTIEKRDGTEYKKCHYRHLPIDTYMNLSSWVELKEVAPAEAKVSIEIYFDSSWNYRKFFDRSEASILQCSDPRIQELLENVKLKHLHAGNERAEEEFNTTVFKGLKIEPL